MNSEQEWYCNPTPPRAHTTLPSIFKIPSCQKKKKLLLLRLLLSCLDFYFFWNDWVAWIVLSFGASMFCWAASHLVFPCIGPVIKAHLRNPIYFWVSLKEPRRRRGRSPTLTTIFFSLCVSTPTHSIIPQSFSLSIQLFSNGDGFPPQRLLRFPKPKPSLRHRTPTVLQAEPPLRLHQARAPAPQSPFRALQEDDPSQPPPRRERDVRRHLRRQRSRRPRRHALRWRR